MKIVFTGIMVQHDYHLSYITFSNFPIKFSSLNLNFGKHMVSTYRLLYYNMEYVYSRLRNNIYLRVEHLIKLMSVNNNILYAMIIPQGKSHSVYKHDSRSSRFPHTYLIYESKIKYDLQYYIQYWWYVPIVYLFSFTLVYYY